MIKKILLFLLNIRDESRRRLVIFWSNKMKNCNIESGIMISKHSAFTNVSIQSGTYVSRNAQIVNTLIGKYCSIGPNLVCGFGIHPINGISTSPAFYSTARQNGFTFSKENKVIEFKQIMIGNDVFIGANVTVLDGVTIGDGAVIGAGAVVSKDIPPYAVAVGCPIKVIKYRFSAPIIEKILKAQWWNKDADTLRKVEKYFFDIESFLHQMEAD